MQRTTDDLRILETRPLPTPQALMREYRRGPRVTTTVSASREAISAILHRHDDRLVVIVGPCSIHDPEAAMEYAERLSAERQRLGGDLEILMRVYFEKPRTTVGWKGLINDPDLDGSFHIENGLRLARRLLLDINALGLPAGCEFLDMITPQYLADLVAWGAIGARTTESQVHRELASGLSCPVGFKNGTDGNVRIAAEAVYAASRPHHFLSTTKDGRVAMIATRGNSDGHVILRGGHQPNYDAASVAAACSAMAAVGQAPRIMIDASHGNSAKDPQRQAIVAEAVSAQLEAGEDRIMGLMLESHLVGGRQDLIDGRATVYGQSITDACIGWDDTLPVLERLALAASTRRAARRGFRQSGLRVPVPSTGGAA